jgi:hypothetical protein
MKSLVQVIAVAAVLGIPVASYAQVAQENAPLTRAQVRAEVVELEKVGYNPANIGDASYPAEIQAAEARVVAEKAAASGQGGVASGSSESGHRVSASDWRAMYGRP